MDNKQTTTPSIKGENNQKYLSTFQFYDEKGRRLSIFAVPDASEMETALLCVYVITCSLKDTFSRKVAKDLFNSIKGRDSEKCNPDITMVPCPRKHTKKEFLKWCRENYYRKQKISVDIQGLVKGNFKIL